MMRKGFTLIEMVFVLAMVGVMLAIAVPRLKVSPMRKVTSAGRQLVADLEVVRTRALSTKKAARVDFDTKNNEYTGYLDDDGDGTIKGQKAETVALRAFGTRKLSGVSYGMGNAPVVPGDAGAGPITFDPDEVGFDKRGVTQPFGARGTIYIVHNTDPDAVAAVAVSGSASFKVWIYRGGTWQ